MLRLIGEQLGLFERREHDERPIRERPVRRRVPVAPRPASDVEPAALLARRLAPLLGRPVASLVLTENRSSILTARPGRRGFALRIHHSFAAASDDLLRQVAVLVEARPRSRARRAALQRVRAHFDACSPPDQTLGGCSTRAPRRTRLEPAGRWFDLTTIRDEINHACFDGRLEVEITWGRRPRRRRRRRSIQLGSYDSRANLVRIHRALDRRGVPRYVVAAVVHHEMLHADVPPRRVGNRRQLHGPEFRRRERAFADYERAEEWLRQHLPRLLR